MKTTFKGLVAGALLVGVQAVQADAPCFGYFGKTGAAGAAAALVNYNLVEDDQAADGVMARTALVGATTIVIADAMMRDDSDVTCGGKVAKYSATAELQKYVAASATAALFFYGANYLAPKAYAAIMAATADNSADSVSVDAGAKGAVKSPMMSKDASMMPKKK